MRTDRNVEVFREVGHLEPRRDAADPRDIRLHDRARVALQIFAEVAWMIDRLADGDRQRCRCCKADVAAEILRGQRLFEPRQVERLVVAGAPDGFTDRKCLIGVDHDVETRPDRLAYRGKAGDVLADMRPADLDLGAAETLRAYLKRVIDQRLRLDMQPAAFGGIDRHGRLRAAGLLPQRPPGREAFDIPQRGIDRGQRKAGDRPHRGRVRCEKQRLPDRLDIERVTAEQPRRQMIPEQCDDRRAAGADRIGVAGADDAVAGVDAHDRGFLCGERLDRVGAYRLRNKIDLQDFDTFDLGHGFPFFGAVWETTVWLQRRFGTTGGDDCRNL